MDVRIADDGEIVTRGPNVFLGYFKEPLATAEVLEDGWLKTGDLGAVDARGLLTITGRKKEIIITAGGKNIAPTNIEAALKNHPLVGEAIVIGDRRKFLSVLVTLDPEAASRFRSPAGLAAADHEDPAIVAEVQRALDAVNEELARVEQVKKFRILPRSVQRGDRRTHADAQAEAQRRRAEVRLGDRGDVRGRLVPRRSGLGGPQPTRRGLALRGDGIGLRVPVYTDRVRRLRRRADQLLVGVIRLFLRREALVEGTRQAASTLGGQVGRRGRGLVGGRRTGREGPSQLGVRAGGNQEKE